MPKAKNHPSAKQTKKVHEHKIPHLGHQHTSYHEHQKNEHMDEHKHKGGNEHAHDAHDDGKHLHPGHEAGHHKETNLKQESSHDTTHEKPIEKQEQQKAEPKLDAKKELRQKLHLQKPKRPERKQRIKVYFEKAGLDKDIKELQRLIFKIAVAVNLLLCSILIYHFSVSYGISWNIIVSSVLILWTLIFGILIFGIWLSFYIFLDLRSFRRKLDVEEVLPDFLQLTASNISAGMTIDRALWFAVRPRFGVLAKEIETIAKATMSGADLKEELEKFSARFDSVLLKRSINMLNEGIDAGGSIGSLLNRIALDIQEQKAMLKEMSANVTTYVIFIGFATICAAPLLFALSGVLINVVGQLGSSVGGSIKAASSAGLPLSFSGAGVTQGDFRIFAMVSLSLSATFSAIMISTIKKGNAKAGVKYIPIFILVSLILYLVVQGIGGYLLGDFFTV